MFRVTTPEITIALKNTDIDLDAAQQIEVTIKQRNLTITKTKTDLSVNSDLRTVSFSLTQEETQKLIDRGALLGDEHGNLVVTMDMLRTMIVCQRMVDEK